MLKTHLERRATKLFLHLNFHSNSQITYLESNYFRQAESQHIKLEGYKTNCNVTLLSVSLLP